MATRSEDEQAYHEGFYGIRSAEELAGMTFADLAIAVQETDAGSPAYVVLDREIRKRLAQDQAVANRPNMILAGCIGGVFGILGAIVGAILGVMLRR